jgi:hypothetical protein
MFAVTGTNRVPGRITFLTVSVHTIGVGVGVGVGVPCGTSCSNI